MFNIRVSHIGGSIKVREEISRAIARTWRERVDQAVRYLGDWLLRHQGTVQAVQWCIVGIYLVLVAVPAVLPLPDRTAHLWTDLTLFAQFAFWGIWWPFVLVSMVLVGRMWCGLLCPEVR